MTAPTQPPEATTPARDKLPVPAALATLNTLTELTEALGLRPPERARSTEPATAAPPDAGATPAAATVLCVDDEANILSALKRVLRGAGCVVLTATSGDEALELLARMPVDLVISDMRMPGMDGAQLLEQVHLRWPDVVRVLLTGHADMGSTVAAINRGRIFRYIHKPWDEHELLGAVHEGLERLALQRDKARLEALALAQNEQLRALNSELEGRVEARTAELGLAHDQLKRNHLKSIKVFSNLLELRGSKFAGHGRRVAETARDIARHLDLPEDAVLQVFVAGLLHDIGMLGISEATLAKPVSRYNFEEMTGYRKHTLQAEQSLMALDELAPLMPIIRSHHECFDGSGFPDKLIGADIPLGARILALADTYDDLQNGHLTETKMSALDARKTITAASGKRFDPAVLEAFLHITEPKRPDSVTLRSVALHPGMVLATDLVSGGGMLMLTAGHALTTGLIERIREFEQREGSHLQIHITPASLVRRHP